MPRRCVIARIEQVGRVSDDPSSTPVSRSQGWRSFTSRPAQEAQPIGGFCRCCVAQFATRIDDSDDDSQLIVLTWRDVDSDTEGHESRSVGARMGTASICVLGAQCQSLLDSVFVRAMVRMRR